MAEDVFFRPALVIFADAAGNDIYQRLCQPALINSANKGIDSILSVDELICHFLQPTAPIESLLHHINIPLRRAIGLARLDNSALHTYRYRLADNEVESASVTLQEALSTMLSEMQEPLSTMLSTIQEDVHKHTIINKEPQVYIVGHIHSPNMYDIVKVVHKCLLRYNSNSKRDIYYLYCSYPVETMHIEDAENASVQALDVISDMASTVDFCFLYEIVDDEIVKLRQDKAAIDYAIALSLLALVATGITSQQEFKNIIQLKQNGSHAFGTLNACLIESPQKVIRTACRAYIASLLLVHWVAESQKQDNVETHAEKTMIAIKEWIQDKTNVLPLPTPHDWRPSWLRRLFNRSISPLLEHYLEPDFTVLLQEDHRKAHYKLKEQTRKLFATELKSDLSYDDWSGKITELQKLWQSEATDLWEAFKIKICELLDQHMNGIWKSDLYSTLPWTIAYADALDQKLAAWEEQLERISDIPSLIAEDAEEFERRQQQVRTAREAMPSSRTLLTLVTIGLIALLVYSFLFLNIGTLLFGRQILQFPLILLIGLMTLICIAASNFLLWYQRFQARKIQAERAFRLLCHTCHISYCQQHDLRKRIDTIKTLRKMIYFLKSDFLTEASKDFDKTSATTFSALFASNNASRTIFVGSEKYFQQNVREAMELFLKSEEKNTLYKHEAHLRPAEQLFQQLSNTPTLPLSAKEVFYNRDALKEYLKTKEWETHHNFYENFCNLMQAAIPNEDIDKEISFKAYVNTGYYNLWNKALSVITQKYLWRQQAQGPEAAFLFLCGSKDALLTAYQQVTEVYKRDDIVKVPTSNASVILDESVPDWLLIVAFYRYL